MAGYSGYSVADLFAEIIRAEKRIRPHVLTTPLLFSAGLSRQTGRSVFLKMESEQHTGSFKFRGALNKLLSTGEAGAARKVITASTGNHGRAVARALQITGGEGTVYLPENAGPAKVAALREYPVELVFHGKTSLETEYKAREAASGENTLWISPYNDPDVIGGQGTVGVELARQADKVDFVFMTVGGGGLASGVGSYLKTIFPEVKLIACLPENSPEMFLSVKAGRIVDHPGQETLSDGSAGGIEADAITFSVCRQIIDDFVLVGETEIAAAIRLMAGQHGKIIEGAAGVCVAGLQKYAARWKDKSDATVIAVICGGNISLDTFRKIICT